MAGYSGWSMSNNAVDAYEDGQMPKSKWSKKLILARIYELLDEGEITIPMDVVERIKAMPLQPLREMLLEYECYHHTSKFYNETEFYSISAFRINGINDTIIKNWLDRGEYWKFDRKVYMTHGDNNLIELKEEILKAQAKSGNDKLNLCLETIHKRLESSQMSK